MKKLKLLLLHFFVLLSLFNYGQNGHINIGYKNKGICIGNSKFHSGLRLNLRDNNVQQINGLNITGVSKAKIANGFTFGLIANYDSLVNGVQINGLVGESSAVNGIVVSGLGYVANKINGVGLAGLAIAGDTLNGLFFSGIGVSYWNSEKIKRINGVSMGLLIGSMAGKMNGVSISIFNNVCDTLNGLAVSAVNRTKVLHGIQFGIWNVAENNRIFRKAPIMNFNFRKRRYKSKEIEN